MFGYSSEELERIRRGPRRLRPWVVALEIAIFGGLALVTWPLWIVNHPERLEQFVEERLDGAAFRAGFEDFVMLPVGTWRDPSSWRFVLKGFYFQPRDPKKPDWRAARMTLTLPTVTCYRDPSRPMSSWLPEAVQERLPEGLIDVPCIDGRFGLHFSWLRVSGLEIHAHQQRPPPPWQPSDPVVVRLSADVVEVAGASFDAPADPPLGLAQLRGLRGTLREVVYRPGVREVSGIGALEADDFTTGAILVHDVVLPDVTLDRSTLRFGGDFIFGQSQGTFSGEIKDFHVRAAVSIQVSMSGASFDDAVKTATGNDSPVRGDLDLELSVQAGGTRPRGKALLVGNARLRRGRVRLPEDTRFIVYDLIRIAPWIQLDAWNEVVLGDLEGRIEFTRGSAVLKGFTYPAGKRKLRVDGTIEGDQRYLMVRLLPREGQEHRPGLGLLLSTREGEQSFRLASREDLLRSTPWVPPPMRKVQRTQEGPTRPWKRKNDEGEAEP